MISLKLIQAIFFFQRNLVLKDNWQYFIEKIFQRQEKRQLKKELTTKLFLVIYIKGEMTKEKFYMTYSGYHFKNQPSLRLVSHIWINRFEDLGNI